MEQTAGQQVAKAASVIMIISIVGKLIGFLREQVIASQFGATELTDAYVAAWTVPLMLVGLVGGAISLAFLPVFMRYLSSSDKKQVWRLTGVVLRLTLIALCLAVVVCIVGAPYIARVLVPNFDAEQQALTVVMLRILLPAAVFMGLATLFNVLLNSHRQFAWPAMSPLALNVGTIVFALVLAKPLGIVGLAYATLLGALVQVTMLGWRVKKNGFPVLHKGSLRHPGVRQVGALAAPIVLGTAFTQIYMLVDKALASGLDTGSIASLNYAHKLINLPVGIFVAAIATAIYPTLSEYAGKGDSQGFGRSVASGLRMLSLVMVPAAVGMFVLRIPIVSLAFERGSFDHDATIKTATALAFYAIGLLGVANIQVLNRAFYSLHDSKTPVKVNIGASIFHIAFALVFVRFFQHGGLALANSVAMLGNMTVQLFLLHRKLGAPLNFLPALGKIGLAAGVMGVLVHFAYALLAPIHMIVGLAGSVGLGVSVYFALLMLLGIEELNQLFRMAKAKLLPAA